MTFDLWFFGGVFTFAGPGENSDSSKLDGYRSVYQGLWDMQNFSYSKISSLLSEDQKMLLIV